MRPLHAIFVIMTVLILVATFVPATTAAPPPKDVYGICESEFERAAEKRCNVTVGESSLFVHVTDDRDSHWTATATLNRGAANQFAENRTLPHHTINQTDTSYRTILSPSR